MNVSVFGLGYVGSVTAGCLAARGHQVIGVETHPGKLAIFQKGESPLFEPGLAPLLEDVHKKGAFRAVDDALEAVSASEVSFICVGTPSQRGGRPDLTHIEHVAREIGEALRQKTGTHTVAVRSTLLPGAIEEVVIPALEKASGKREGVDFHVLANPEFMREGSAIADFYAPPFVVIGRLREGSDESLAEIYKCVDGPVIRTSLRSAEVIKCACNAFHALKITFANELGQFCKAQGIDSHEVAEVFCLDDKLNISKAYLKPGLAYGGSCLPKDLRALVGRARDNDLDLPLFESIARSNQLQIQRTADLIMELGHRDVTLLGLSFKAGTDDLRESPLVLIGEALLGKGFRLTIHDSEVELTRLLGANKQYLEEKLPHIGSLLCPSVEEAVKRAKTIVVCKKAPEYANLASLVTPDQHVVDLAATFRSKKVGAATYHGLYW